jgi:cytochrome c-type biogenesis protein CcmH/NrfG
MILLLLTVAAVTGFGAVGHLVTRYNANQQSRGHKFYELGLADAHASHYEDAIAAFRAALSCDPTNSQYQLALARALRDSGDPQRLDEAQSYLIALWQRSPQDASVNLALARVAAHRGSIGDATGYYHNAMYGVWNSDPDGNRNRARIELVQFLLKKKAFAQADSELIALAAALPDEAAAHLEAAQLFDQTQDYPGALTQFEQALRYDPVNPAALSGAGEAAYRSSDYTLANRYLQKAVEADPANTEARKLLELSELIVASNPFHSHVSDVERNRRITTDFDQAEQRLKQCAHQVGVDLNGVGNMASSDPGSNNPKNSSAAALAQLQSRWLQARPQLEMLHSPAETDLPDQIMDVVFQIEQTTAATCGPPDGHDLALLMISQKREAAAQ